ncbi:hypothetical protein ZWY2020_049187 [Hordeum vulgare]|nr:hypothetical protein ZWY2020_049187 [Hordeum vulgare]
MPAPRHSLARDPRAGIPILVTSDAADGRCRVATPLASPLLRPHDLLPKEALALEPHDNRWRSCRRCRQWLRRRGPRGRSRTPWRLRARADSGARGFA